DVHAAGKGVRDDERRRGEVIEPGKWIDAALEVSVARQHGGGDKLLVFDRFGNRIGQGAGVPDTGRATIADDLKAKLVQVLEETGRFVILGDDARAGRGRCFYPRLHGKATLDRVSRKHTRGQ